MKPIKQKISNKPKIGLMLGGGGAKGAYQVGVIRALFETKLFNRISAISGTSIGAINTLLLMSMKKEDQIYEIWDEIESKNVFGTKAKLFGTDVSRMYSLSPLVDTFIDKISLKAVRKSKFRGYATAAKMYSKASIIHQLKTNTMEKIVFNLNEMENPFDAVLASASMPVIFGPTIIDGVHYVDGGLLDNYPIQPLIDEGCNIILTVALDHHFNPHLYDDLDINIIDFTSRSAFDKSLIQELVGMVTFNNDFKDEKENLGYLVGNLIIEKLYEEKNLKKFLGFNLWKKQEGFKVITLSEEDELYIKRTKHSKRMERKAKKRLKKKEKKNKKGDNI